MQSGAGAHTAPNPTAATTRSVLSTVVRDYLTLTKPKVQSLLLFTTVTTMYVAGDPSLGLVLLTCLGGALSAGGAGAINHWFDRDLDAAMSRTAGPPLPARRGGDAPPDPALHDPPVRRVAAAVLRRGVRAYLPRALGRARRGLHRRRG